MNERNLKAQLAAARKRLTELEGELAELRGIGSQERESRLLQLRQQWLINWPTMRETP